MQSLHPRKGPQSKCIRHCYESLSSLGGFHFRRAARRQGERLRTTSSYSFVQVRQQAAQARMNRFEKVCQDNWQYSRRRNRSAQQGAYGADGRCGRLFSIYDFRFQIYDLFKYEDPKKREKKALVIWKEI